MPNDDRLIWALRSLAVRTEHGTLEDHHVTLGRAILDDIEAHYAPPASAVAAAHAALGVPAIAPLSERVAARDALVNLSAILWPLAIVGLGVWAIRSARR